MPYRIGEEIALPEEPPVGSIVMVYDAVGGFEIERDADGWFVRAAGPLKRSPWREIIRAWGTNGTPLRIVHLPPPPPPRPRKCENCEVTYDACTIKLRNTGKCCCGACFSYSTHYQNAWERVHGSRLISEIVS